MGKPRLYLLTVFSPSLQAEHAAIEKAVSFHSDGDFVKVFAQQAGVLGAKATGAEIPFTVSYLFSTTKLMREMGFGLLERDGYLLIEVTTFHHHGKLAMASTWLDRHQVPK